MFMLKSNQLINQSMLNGTLVIEMVSNSFSKNKKNLSRLIKRETFKWEKMEIWAVRNRFPLDISKCLSYSEVQKNSKVVNV